VCVCVREERAVDAYGSGCGNGAKVEDHLGRGAQVHFVVVRVKQKFGLVHDPYPTDRHRHRHRHRQRYDRGTVAKWHRYDRGRGAQWQRGT
jgi:hypothetical protein